MTEAVLQELLNRKSCPICEEQWARVENVYQTLSNLNFPQKDLAWVRQQAMEYGWLPSKVNLSLSAVLIYPKFDEIGIDYYACPYCDTMWRGDNGKTLYHSEAVWVRNLTLSNALQET